MIPTNIQINPSTTGPKKVISFDKVFKDPSFYLLLFVNLMTIYFAYVEGWNLMTVVWVYWFQSIIIGIFNFIRMLSLNNFSTENLLVNGQPVEATNKTKISLALFFAFHYGFFHLVYLIFLGGGFFSEKISDIQAPDFKIIFFISFVFLINHLFSYFYNRKADAPNINIGRVMFYPYKRIVPMHLTIMLGQLFIENFHLQSSLYLLILFLSLKTIVDLFMHVDEHASYVPVNPEIKLPTNGA